MFDALITIAFGIISTLMGYGKIAVSKDAVKNREYLKKFGTLLRICGITLIVAGILLMISKAVVL